MTRRKLVMVPAVQGLIKPSPGFEKKGLAEFKLDLLALCEFGCRYCSSNLGNYLRIRRAPFADLTQAQLGERLYPESAPELTFHFKDVVGQLKRELATKSKAYGAGRTLVFSMLTDGFSPSLVHDGTTLAALELLLEHSSFRLRVLTKNAIVGSDAWCRFFSRHRDRFVVGLSVGTSDDAWAQRVEVGTSLPSARLRALRRLQDAGIPTYGMLCPVFPNMLEGNALEDLLASVRPERCEHVWAEPFNDRANWRAVQAAYDEGSADHTWFTRAFDSGRTDGWSSYAVQLYRRLRAAAESGGWLERLRFLLYEHHVADDHVCDLDDLQGVLLQSKATKDGLSQHPGVAEIQRHLRPAEQASGRRST